MKEPVLKIKKNYPDAVIPKRQYDTDSGLDLIAYKFVKLYRTKEYKEYLDSFHDKPQFLSTKEIERKIEDKELNLFRGERVLIDTGVSATVEKGYEIQIRPRSGLALKKGLTVLNTPGTIDESYRGMLGVILINLSTETQKIKIGERIAQMVVSPVILCETIEVGNLDESVRGIGGFGHTGT